MGRKVLALHGAVVKQTVIVNITFVLYVLSRFSLL